MDNLALLCNLYGDGPPTLRRLREAGCVNLAAIEAFEAERLASLLRTSVRSARRFQVEARMLRERSEGQHERVPARAEAEQEVAVGEPARSSTPAAGDPLIERVLTVWGERDSESAQRAEVAASPPLPAAPAAAPPAPAGDLGELDGVDEELLESLEQAGVHSLTELRDADALTLAMSSRLGYTRLVHLQFLARRALRQRPGPARDDVLVPRPRPERRGPLAQGRPAPAPELAATAWPPRASLRFSPALEPRPAESLDMEAELERFAREARAALERDATGAPLSDEGGSGPFA